MAFFGLSGGCFSFSPAGSEGSFGTIGFQGCYANLKFEPPCTLKEQEAHSYDARELGAIACHEWFRPFLQVSGGLFLGVVRDLGFEKFRMHYCSKILEFKRHSRSDCLPVLAFEPQCFLGAHTGQRFEFQLDPLKYGEIGFWDCLWFPSIFLICLLICFYPFHCNFMHPHLQHYYRNDVRNTAPLQDSSIRRFSLYSSPREFQHILHIHAQTLFLQPVFTWLLFCAQLCLISKPLGTLLKMLMFRNHI